MWSLWAGSNPVALDEDKDADSKISLTQSAEQGTLDPRVAGSTPAGILHLVKGKTQTAIWRIEHISAQKRTQVWDRATREEESAYVSNVSCNRKE